MVKIQKTEKMKKMEKIQKMRKIKKNQKMKKNGKKNGKIGVLKFLFDFYFIFSIKISI